MNILGISCYFHDAAAAVITDGRLIAAAEEERFTRKKHDYEFPQNAIDFCLGTGGHPEPGFRLRCVLRKALYQIRAASLVVLADLSALEKAFFGSDDYLAG